MGVKGDERGEEKLSMDFRAAEDMMVDSRPQRPLGAGQRYC